MPSSLENRVRTLLNDSVKAEIIEPKTKTLEQLAHELMEINAKIKAYTKTKRQRPLSFGETLDLNCQKHNFRSLDNLLLYKQAQQRANTTGPVNIFDL